MSNPPATGGQITANGLTLQRTVTRPLIEAWPACNLP